VNIVMPMAGRGSRFVEVGVTVPKPLISVLGRPMYTWAMDALPLEQATKVIFLCLAEHLEDLALQQDILQRYGHLNPVIIPVAEVTEGQACTVLLAEEHIDNDEPLVIFNADTTCRSNLTDVLAERPDAAGVISVFSAPGDKWSFARLDDDGRVVETAEKVRISGWATTGLYHFSRGRDFVRHAKEMIAEDDRVKGEFYVIPVYNRMLAAGDAIYPEMADDVWVLGTPDDLAHFLDHHPSES